MRINSTMFRRLMSLAMLSSLSATQLFATGASIVSESAIVSLQKQFSLSGVVTDAAGVPVIGATVLVVGSESRGTFTDATGAFTLSVTEGETLEVSMMGYTPFNYLVTTATSASITLEEDAVQVDDVVVTALGIKRSAKALGYAASEVGGDALVEARQPNITNSLAGMVPGLQVSKGAGSMGSSKIVLRGANSLTGTNQPLIVVDGVPIDNFVGGSNDMWGGTDMGNGLSDLNAEDIESMTVLKGGSAAALYGSRAGNGVILVTTKSGKANKGLGITVSSSIAIEDALRYPEMQNTYSQGENGLFDNLSRQSWGTRTDGTATGTNWKGETETLQTYDNIGNFFGTGIMDSESVTLSQQYNKTSVYASVGRMNNNTMSPNSRLNRTNIVMRATTNLGESDRWKLDTKVNYVKSKGFNRTNQGISTTNLFKTVYELPRSLDITQFNPSVDENGKQIWWDTESSPQDNPWWTSQYNQNTDERDRYIGFMSLSYKFTDWLTGEVKGGLDSYSTVTEQKKYTGGLSTPAGSYSTGMEEFTEANYSFLFTAQKDNIWGDFGGNASFGGNMMEQDRRTMDANVSGLVVPNLFSLGNGVDKATVSSGLTRRKMNSLYGSAQLNWRGAIFLDGTLRNDWSSTMSKENQSYMYPSVSLAGLISEMADLPEFISFAKVRGSFAVVGNDLAPYQLYNTYSIGQNHFEITQAEPGRTYFDDTLVSEKVKSWEAGIDVRFFQNKLSLDASWYKANATNQLIGIPTDPSSGYQSRMVNAGNIQNEGIEVVLGATIMERGDFSWDATLNFSHNKATILELTDEVFDYALSGNLDNLRVIAETNDYQVYNAETGKYEDRTRNGGFGNIYGSIVRRVEDESSPYYGQWLLNDEGLPVEDTNGTELYMLGNQNPDAMISLSQSFRYKNLSVSALVDARIGGEVYSMTNALLDRNGNSINTVGADGNRGELVVPGVVATTDADGNITGYNVNTTPTTYEKYYSDAMGVGNFGIIEPHVYDATNVRLRNLTLGYNFPKKWLGNSIQRMNLSVTAYNLWLIYSATPGIDPESVSGTSTNATALELGLPPTTRSFTVNLTIGF